MKIKPIYYKKIDIPPYKYELTQTSIYKIPPDKFFWAFIKQIDQSPINEDFIKIKDGLMTILKGYRCDGASGPTFDTKNSFNGAFVHDALYQLMRIGLLPQSCKPYVDMWFYRLLRDDGMWNPRAWSWHRGVVRHGGSSCALLPHLL